MKKNHNIIDLKLLKSHETEKAIAVLPDIGDSKQVWLPKSQIEIHSEDKSGFVDISLPEPLAEEKGLI